jgi:addiction module HigA family antidote
MGMHNPPYPGEFIRSVYLDPFQLSARQVATKLRVSPSIFNRVLNKESAVTPEMALRLAKTLGRSPESWLTMQRNHDRWQARQRMNLKEVEKLELPAA